MEQETADPWLAGCVLAIVFASFAAWCAIIDRRLRGPILAYEPRRAVPWDSAVLFLPAYFVVMPVGALLVQFVSQTWGRESPVPPEVPGVDEMLPGLAFGMSFNVLLVGVTLLLVNLTARPSWADLGLPRGAHELGRDIRIGVVAWLVAVVPVYVVQLLLVSAFGEPQGHPLIRLLEGGASPSIFLAAFVAAVVVAPVVEEIAFRLLLQGWLEKWEARRTNDETRMTNEDGLASVNSPLDIRHSSFLPHGWLPIAVSSLLFSLAHIGYGLEPVPLFILAVVLGYTYQRTHRIVPCIVTHALFNGTSLFALWRITSAAAP